MESTHLAQRTVGEIVAEDYRRAAVLKRFGIDFCCGGGKTLEAACQKRGVAVEDVERALATADGQGRVPEVRVMAWSPAFLADYVVNEHHGYVRESIPVLRAFTQKVARVHGGARPELVEIAALFDEAASELEDHMDTEETVVFPRIRALTEGRGAAQGPSLRALIAEMEAEHDRAGDLMREIRRLSGDYVPPEGACNTYRAAFAKLEEFEEDLHRHVHLENNVLFPKAVALEASGALRSTEPAAVSAGAPTAPVEQHGAQVLDVRVIPPPQKHPAIFSAFDGLAAGAHFVLVNDHDPVPLRYQFEYTRGGQVGWEYLEQGPDLWRVKISKLDRVEA